MHFVRHYSLYRYEKTELETLLETKYQIPVDVTELFENSPYLVTFDVHENHPHIEEINKLLPVNGENAKICSLGIELEPSIGWYEYSEKDHREAKWLEISSHNQKVCPTNRDELFTGHCLKDESLREKDYLYVQGQGVFSKYWHEDVKLDTVVSSSIYFGKKFFRKSFLHRMNVIQTYCTATRKQEILWRKKTCGASCFIPFAKNQQACQLMGCIG